MNWIEQLEENLKYCNDQLDFHLKKQRSYKIGIKILKYKIDKLNALARIESAEALKKSENIKTFLKKE